MLRLEKITKVYGSGDNKVHALKGVSVAFRKNEFVSILGHSGCGKTTLLNIIGGLDKYTDGNLFIDDISTKKYKDRDWDRYRNERIGFVFQSYNLIPHQTVLGNVELALTISGITKKERVKRAKEALEKVGLKGQFNKKPNQLSGGQCQRVAIARALVNDPEILLADEPTGALDTETSVQIMDLIKEIAKERLVIMVTHNPELANQYSTRIINLKDGEIVGDTMPFSVEEEKEELALIKKENEEKLEKLKEIGLTNNKVKKSHSKAKMSFFTAFRLSAQNLITKKGRTVTVGIAGSIGIIGIALVLAISAGIKNYVASIQDDMLSGNPIQISDTAYDLTSFMEMTSTEEKVDIVKNPNSVYINSLLERIAKEAESLESIVYTNDLDENYIEYLKEMPKDYYSAMIFDYGLNLGNNIYLDFESEDGTVNVSYNVLHTMYTALLSNTAFSDYTSYVSMLTNSFKLAPDNDDYILSQYDVLDGKIATEANEIMLVVDSETQVSDILLAELGYYSQDEFLNLAYYAAEDELYDESIYKYQFSYDELLGKTFVWHSNDAIFTSTGELSNPFTYTAYGTDIENDEDAMTLTVVGILQPKEEISYGCLTSGVYYTSELAEYIVEKNKDSEIVEYAKSLGTDTYTSTSYMGVNTGITYDYSYTYLDVTYSDLVGFVGSTDQTAAFLSMYSSGASSSKTSSSDISDYTSSGDIDYSAYTTMSYYTLSLRELGGESVPNTISIYPVDFDNKDLVTDYLDAWNEDKDIVVNGVTLTKEDRLEVHYTDVLSLIITIINTMVNVISYGLIAFTSISLVVSTVMIGIITYVSVVERIKEIGVIRSLGGRKKDVSHLFNAETFIIGLLSGLIGIGFTYLVSIPINAVIKSLTGISGIAALPVNQAVILVILSIVLTLISGLMPARSAAKKDPVVALRTE